MRIAKHFITLFHKDFNKFNKTGAQLIDLPICHQMYFKIALCIYSSHSNLPYISDVVVTVIT